MQLGSIHHLGIVVPDLDRALAVHAALTGARLFAGPLPTAEGGARIAFLDRGDEPLLEFIEPVGTAADLRGFLSHCPEGGLHHICYRAADIHACRRSLAASGARFASAIVEGVLGRSIFFVEPATAGGVLTEVIELPEGLRR